MSQCSTACACRGSPAGDRHATRGHALSRIREAMAERSVTGPTRSKVSFSGGGRDRHREDHGGVAEPAVAQAAADAYAEAYVVDRQQQTSGRSRTLSCGDRRRTGRRHRRHGRRARGRTAGLRGLQSQPATSNRGECRAVAAGRLPVGQQLGVQAAQVVIARRRPDSGLQPALARQAPPDRDRHAQRRGSTMNCPAGGLRGGPGKIDDLQAQRTALQAQQGDFANGASSTSRPQSERVTSRSSPPPVSRRTRLRRHRRDAALALVLGLLVGWRRRCSCWSGSTTACARRRRPGTARGADPRLGPHRPRGKRSAPAWACCRSRSSSGGGRLAGFRAPSDAGDQPAVLENLGQDKQVVAISSASGSEDKSTITASLANTLADAGLSVAIVSN